MSMNLGRAWSQDEHVTTPIGSEHGMPNCKKSCLAGPGLPCQRAAVVFLFSV